MKKTTAIILSALFICTSLLCGCSSEESKPQSGPAEASSTVKEKEAFALEKGTTYTFKPKEIWCENNGNKIYGIAYIPDTNKKCPLVITCHGLGTNHEAGIGYAEHYAKIGVATYTFDFCGGTKSSDTNKSDGKSTDMSVMTESADLEAVFNTAQTWDFVDTSRIFFQGGSQGGLVSAITGVRLKDKIAGMILLYPAFGMYDFLEYGGLDLKTIRLDELLNCVCDVFMDLIFNDEPNYIKSVRINNKIVFTTKSFEPYSNDSAVEDFFTEFKTKNQLLASEATYIFDAKQ